MKKCWVIPPECDGDFVAQMEDVLDVYERPVVGMDEQPNQLIGETLVAIPVAPGQTLRYDYQYVRNGTVTNFMFSQPLGDWRRVSVRERKTCLDWAEEIAHLLDVDFPDAEVVVLVMDNLNTHNTSSLYEAFPPEEAFRLSQRLEIHYTPKHGSWLNIAECELSALAAQCLGDRRIPDIESLNVELEAWHTQRNMAQKGVDWQFTTDDARIKLKRLYPEIL